MIPKIVYEVVDADFRPTNWDFSRSFRFSGKEIKALMRANGVTIRSLKDRTGITMKRIREIRQEGLVGHLAIDWFEAITGSLTPRMKAALRQRVL